ncbi:LOG family protein domain protein [Candida albicans]|nr:LOG family protein domain protein [Candida albicans]
MHTRKRLMAQEADAFVALPGGIGSIDELAEITTWCQLNIHGKPIVVYNVDGYYDNFFKMIQGFVDCGFLSEKNGQIIKVANSVEEVLEIIENYEIPEGRFNLKWETT